jgi:TonB family protein
LASQLAYEDSSMNFDQVRITPRKKMVKITIEREIAVNPKKKKEPGAGKGPANKGVESKDHELKVASAAPDLPAAPALPAVPAAGEESGARAEAAPVSEAAKENESVLPEASTTAGAGAEPSASTESAAAANPAEASPGKSSTNEAPTATEAASEQSGAGQSGVGQPGAEQPAVVQSAPGPPVAIPPVDTAKLFREAIDNVFAQGLDDRMVAAMPEFWRLYYQAAAVKADYRPTDPSILRQNTVDVKARLVTSFEPDSNEFAQANGIVGMALYHTVVGPDGKAGEIAVARPIGFGLDENAVEAIRKASFQPAVKDGHPVAVLLDLVVQFRIFSQRTAAVSQLEPVEGPAEAMLPGPYSVPRP